MIVDLRSDALTLPTASMRKAMAEFTSGEDGFQDEPPVTQLQSMLAEKCGKEDAVFMATGTMSNLASTIAHCWQRGCEMYLGENTHAYKWEQGGIAQLGGIFPKGIKTLPSGELDLNDLRSKHLFGGSIHHGVGKLIIIENTTNGLVLCPEYFQRVRQLADELGLRVHLDGARIANACVASGVELSEFMKYVDSASISLNKGLGAPGGSVVVGNKTFIAKVKRIRKALGGNMLQMGAFAAAGLIAVEDMWQRVSNDHTRALHFAKECKSFNFGFVDVDVDRVHTNIVMLKIVPPFTAKLIVDKMKESTAANTTCVRMTEMSRFEVRAVVYHSITDQHITAAVLKFKDVCQQLSCTPTKSICVE